jgi:hypothetical protein
VSEREREIEIERERSEEREREREREKERERERERPFLSIFSERTGDSPRHVSPAPLLFFHLQKRKEFPSTLHSSSYH